MRVYSIGIFTKYKEEKDRFSCIHNSPCKIFKILDELNNFIDFKYEVNNYNIKYDFAICDRFVPKRKINANRILNFSEAKPVVSWATDYCSTTLSDKIKHKNQFRMLNYCQGIKLSEAELNKDRKGLIFLGRVTGQIEKKLIILSKNINVDILPIKYWYKGDILRFHNKDKKSRENLKFLQRRFNLANIVEPVDHNGLYRLLNRKGYKIGFAPSVYSLDSKKIQIESSSKFFEYIGCGIPVLVEATVPEAKLVRENPFLGKVFLGKREMVAKARAMSQQSANYNKILKYANENHFANSRAKSLYEKFITKGLRSE